MNESEGQKLQKSLKKLEDNSSPRVAKFLRWVQNPKARRYRIPIGLALIIAGALGVLPVFGIWMVPVGLLLLALDVPFLQAPIGKLILWTLTRWQNFKSKAHG